MLARQLLVKGIHEILPLLSVHWIGIESGSHGRRQAEPVTKLSLLSSINRNLDQLEAIVTGIRACRQPRHILFVGTEACLFLKVLLR